ncbi:aminopeptidase P, putative [Plasmodium chabaudi chabaudi]|uniref:Aminopeptidase P, putative n=1 Tax=Plasmodium chabaudi chabaudi TaxID=31271 RepID=A0A1C6XJ60_PLACU|nr:aminopeptidase P, putative [Plasmodium chabaudi chabaudi]
MRINSLIYANLLFTAIHANFFTKGNKANYVSAYINTLHRHNNNDNKHNIEDSNKINVTNTGKSQDQLNNYFSRRFYTIQNKNQYLREGKRSSTDDNLTNYNMESSNEQNNQMMGGDSYKERLQKLKKYMGDHNIDVYILINSDAHNSEIINDQDKKIYYLTNYSGADGILILTKDQQIIYVNALYELQATKELDTKFFDLKIGRITNKDEIFQTIADLEFNTIAFDGKNTSVSFYEKLKNKLKFQYPDKQIQEKFIYKDSINKIVKDKNINLYVLESPLVTVPNDNVNKKPVFIYDREFGGACAAQKIQEASDFFDENPDVDSMLLSELDEIAYLLNLRGYDYVYSPLFYSYVYLKYNREKGRIDEIILFAKTENIKENVLAHLDRIHVKLMDYDSVVSFLTKNVSTKTANITRYNENNLLLSSLQGNTNPRYDISLSPHINLMVYMLFNKEKVLLKKSPIVDMKAVKNYVEMDSIKEAHVLDGLALLQFFHWCDEKRKTKELFKETEISLRNKIDYFRSTKKNFIFPSFSTISAIGPNSAVIHYESTEETNAKITPSIYLLDSGGQYLYGTTDVTRTTHFGEPNADEKKLYTLVLKGHLSLRKVIFASYTNSMALDFLARQPLYNHFLDYNHGTGHGVGICLNVHEGGCSISPAVGTPLKESMVLSNEPGYYWADHFGIRIENMQFVVTKKQTDDTTFLTFNDLTLYPYEKKLLDYSLLTPQEIADINEYHLTIRNTLLPRIKENPSEYDKGVEQYLMEITEPISH